MTDKDKRDRYHSADWATIDKNSGVIHVRWWIPLVIVAGAMFLIAMSCSLIWGYRNYISKSSSNTHSNSNLQVLVTENPKFENLQEAEQAYMDLYDQIDSFCKTVKSPQ